MTCTFFGHRITPKEIEPTLRSTLIDLIEKHDVNLFYVGNHGEFDTMVCRVLRELSNDYSFRFYIILAYMPKDLDESGVSDNSHTILPSGIETVPRRFAVSYRNKWMLQHADCVVTYVSHEVGSGAAQFKCMAERQKKTVINIS